MAERVGFEPTVPLTVHKLSKRAPSTTRPSLLKDKNVTKYYQFCFNFNYFIQTDIIIYKIKWRGGREV